METDTVLALAVRLGFLGDLKTKGSQCLIAEISKMITAIRAKLLRS
jgi:hypothetical protein